MHTGVERHILHLTMDLVGGTLPTANRRGVEPAYSVLFRRPPIAIHVITVVIMTLEMTSISRARKDNPKSFWIFVVLVVHQG
jgi:hypothetical protein